MAMTELTSKWDRVLEAYSGHDWPRALDMLKAFSANYLEDLVAKIYIDRVVGFLSKTPPTDWDGIRRFDTK
jgi:adenylate cyclase